MPTYHNPENALKRAFEFCGLGKNEEALDCLYDALKNKKHRMMKQVHENIINKFLELCVEFKRGQTAKDGLYSYRNICQGVNLKSWEDAIRKYLQLAESKVNNALELSQSAILDVDDLEQDVTPEILLKSVSSEGLQERNDRVVLLPWIKFLWNCYRNCLDILRNSRIDTLYHIVAQHALKFCVKFSRKTELRKLCNIIRVHAVCTQRRQTYTKAEDTEIQLLFLETGFTELESAIYMELWQDAFKALENIHSVIAASKKFQYSRMIARYFEKLSSVLWKGEEYLFHAAAVLRCFLLYRDQKKNLSSIDITKLASRTVLSVLAVPFQANNLAIDLVAETDVSVINKKHRLLSVMVDMPQYLTRSALIKEIMRLNIIQCVPKEISDAFQTMEFQMEPTKLNVHISNLTGFVNGWTDCNLEQYIPLVHKVAVVRLLSVLSKIYKNVKISKLLDLAALPEMSYFERILVDSARKYEFPLTIDHRNQCVHFSSEFNIFQSRKFSDEDEFNESFHKIDLKYLMHIHSSLMNVVVQICPEREKNKNKLIAAKIAGRYFRECEAYRKKLLERKIVIEKHKEDLEYLRLQKEEEKKRLINAKLLEYEAAEKERLMRETEERNLRRLRREQEEIKRKILLEKMETFKKSGVGREIVENLDILDLDNTDPQILFSKQIKQINKERRELSSRLRRQERSFDHVERAKRVEEIPMLIEQYEEARIADRELWNESGRKKIESACKDRARDLLKKGRLLEIKPDLEAFILSIKRKHADNYVQKMTEFIETMEKERYKQLKERAENRKIKRKDEWVIQQELRQKIDEKLRLKNKQDSTDKGIGTKSERHVNIQTKNIKDPDAYFIFRTARTAVGEEPTTSQDTFKTKEVISSCYGERSENLPSTISSPSSTKGAQYFNRKYQLRSEEILHCDSFKQKTTYFSEFSSKMCTKDGSENFGPSFNISRKIHTGIVERRDEPLLSRKIPGSRTTDDSKSSYASRWSRVRREDPIPEKPVTIIKRADARLEIQTVPEDLDPVSEVRIRREEPVLRRPVTIIKRATAESEMQTDTEALDPVAEASRSSKIETESYRPYSCTPWAKLKREEKKK